MTSATTSGATSGTRQPLSRRLALTGRLNPLVIGGRLESGRAVLSPRGELVHGCADTLSEALTLLPATTRRVDLHMTGVVFMDTAGLQFLDLLGDYGRQHRVPVTATHWNGQPRRILELAGLDTTDPLHSTAHQRDPAPGRRPPPLPSAVALERAEQLNLLRQEIEQLRRAIASRPVIDQARGILMATHACTSRQAWDILRETSQRSNTKLHTVAAAVTASTSTDGPAFPDEVRTALRAVLARHR